MVNCKECKINFTKTSNLRAHVKRKHPDKLELLAPKIKYQHRTHTCRECSANFVNLANLRVHVKQKHPGKLEELAPLKQKVFMCKHCQNKFKMLKELTLHKKTCTEVKKLKCPLCQFQSPRSTIIDHYREVHALNIDCEEHEFDSFEIFKEWKLQIEKETFASFVNMHGTKQNVSCKKIKYVCHRSGDIRQRGNHIRTFKTQGSNKINAFCPAAINVVIKNERCFVTFSKTHVGHKQEQDLGHLFLSVSDRQHIADKIASKIPFQKILNDVKESVSNCDLERLHLLTKKDLYNIKEALNKSSVRNQNGDQKEVSENRSSSQQVNLLEEQQKLVQILQEQILSTTSIEELEAVNKIVTPIKPTLEAFRNNKQTDICLLPSTSYAPEIKRIEPG